MNSRERMIAALEKRPTDHLPATTHHLMSSFLTRIGCQSELEFFDRFGLDAIRWVGALNPGADESRWRLEREEIPDCYYRTFRWRIHTPRGTLSMTTQNDGRTDWVQERLIKCKREIDLIECCAPLPECDVESVEREADAFGGRGIIRGAVPGFPIYGQPGCWQDAAVLYGIEALIMETFDDPSWVAEFLAILQRRKLAWLQSAHGARFDLIELGGGDASASVISPRIFERFVAPFDAPLVDAAHESGLRIVYHTCGGMMPILEMIADMGVDAMETFTPRSMGGDADLAEAKRRIGDRVCMIGGYDQFHCFVDCPESMTRREVHRCFRDAGPIGYILAPSDHFFEADVDLLYAYAEEAKSCVPD